MRRANLAPAPLKFFRAFIDRTEDIIARAQAQNTLRKDVKARYLTYIFLGAIEAFVSTMVIENYPIRGKTHKQRIALSLLTVFFNGARPI
jgi:hypothetical protein